jgi:Domain of unknown function (DUF929)
VIRSATSARRTALAVAVSSAALFGSVAAAAAAAAPAPRDALRQALGQVHALARQTSARTGPARAAASALARATLPGLWINDQEADAPPYGRNVFTASGQAVEDLVGLSAHGGTTAVELILAAARELAENAIAQARGGPAAVLATARKARSAGDRQAHVGQLSAAVGSYGKAWQSAYDAVTRLVASEVTSVPSATLAAASEQALGTTRFGMAGPRIEQGLTPLTSGGKPEVFYAGSEACPFCGVQRWGMIVALSQFGTFSNLKLMESVAQTPPQVTTFTFFGSSYRSPYISFVPVEVWSNVPKPPGLAPLQTLTHPEAALVHRFDPAVETPFIDVANRFITDRSTVTPRLIARKSWMQLAGGLTDPSNVSTQAIAGEAEVLTAEVCEATGGNPQSVCSSAVVQQYEAALPTLTGKGGSCPAPPSPGGPPPARDAAARPHHRGTGTGPVAIAARCQV